MYSYPCTRLDEFLGPQEFKASSFIDIRHMEVVRLSALRTDRLCPPGNIPGTHFCLRLSRPQGHSAATTCVVTRVPKYNNDVFNPE